MNISEKIVEACKDINLTVDNYKEETQAGLEAITTVFRDRLVGTELVHRTYGSGVITNVVASQALDTTYAEIDFSGEIRKFSLHAMLSSPMCPIRITDPECVEAMNTATELYTEWHWKSVDLSAEKQMMAREAEKQAEEEKKAELKYQRQKESSIKAFDNQIAKTRDVSGLDEFYYALGWIIKHMNSISAVLPDYLENAFKNHFGVDTPCRVVDSKHRGPAGWQSQWSWSFKISLKKYDDIPSILVPYISPSGKEITNTEFIWNLIDVYGFKFGKKPDETEIESKIPLEFFNIYLAGKA